MKLKSAGEGVSQGSQAPMVLMWYAGNYFRPIYGSVFVFSYTDIIASTQYHT